MERTLRVNVVVQEGQQILHRFLCPIPEQALITELWRRIQLRLRIAQMDHLVQRLTNESGFNLNQQDQAGYQLHDRDVVVAVVQYPVHQAEPPANPEGPPQVEPADAQHQPMLAPGTTSTQVFLEDVETAPNELTLLPASASGGAAAVPSTPSRIRLKGPGDWEVHNLSPKFKEYISARFRDVNGRVSEPGNTYITVEMIRSSTEPSYPVRYSLARIDVIEFERLAGRKLQDLQLQTDYFIRCQEALQRLLESGAPPEEITENWLPYRFRKSAEFESALRDAQSSSFRQADVNRPLVIIDTSGASGEVLPTLKLALKRILYSSLVNKSRFNLMAFAARDGLPYAFRARMVQPSAEELREAEAWIDGLRPVPQAWDRLGSGPQLLEALRLGFQSREVDSVYLLTSGALCRYLEHSGPGQAQGRFLEEVRARNFRELPLHIIGIECDPQAEVTLRAMAEQNQGTFRQKRFDAGAPTTPTFARPMSRQRGPQQPCQEGFSIGGQLQILSIMLEESQSERKQWLQEKACANQVLLSTQTHQAVMQPQQASLSMWRQQEGQTRNVRLETLVQEGTADLIGNATRPLPPRPTSGRAGPNSGQEEVRRPSMANPADRPGLEHAGVISVSEILRLRREQGLAAAQAAY